ncbi:hypothetical protein Tco_0245477 [Tanacetum coccineum]
MVYVVNSVLASGVDIIVEEDFVRFALLEMKIHPLMLLIRTLSMTLQTLSLTLHNPRTNHTCVNYVGMTLIMPSRHFNPIYYDDDDYEESTIPLNEIVSQIPPSIAIIPVLPTLEPENSLIIGDEDLSSILEKESDEVIKSSVEDLVPIQEKSVTLSNPLFDSNDDFTSSDNESLSNEDVPEDNVKIYSNPLFEFDDEYISSDVNPLFNEVLMDIESEESYVSKLDEPDLLVTPLSKPNEDECFDPGGDVDDVELLLHRDSSTPKIRVASILEGFTDEPPLEENDDLFDLESKENEWKKILYDAPIDDLMIEDKDCPNYEDSHARGFVHRSLDLQSFACLNMGIRYPRSY